MNQRCSNCRFSVKLVGGGEDDGFCYRYPPEVDRVIGGALQGTYPPVNLNRFWCGEWLKRKGNLFQRSED